MVFDPTASLKFLQSTLGRSGFFEGGVVIGEPFSPPTNTTAALMNLEFEPSQATLNTTIDVWTVLIRIYLLAGTTPENAEPVEIESCQLLSKLLATVCGAFTLGGTVRAIDWAGEEADRRTSAKWGHLTVAGTIFRIVDVTVPFIVDDSATFAA